MGINLRFENSTPPGFGQVIFQKAISSDLQAKAVALDELLQIMTRHQVFRDADEATRMRLCLDEVLVNAIVHGNEMASDKHVTVTVYLAPDRLGVRIEDEGCGFDPADVPDPDDPESLLLEGGRGVLIVTTFMDEVTYYGRGSRVLLIRKLAHAGSGA